MKKLGMCAALLFIAAGLGRADPINLVQNGSFELTNFPVADNSFQVFFPEGHPNPFQIPGWRSVLPTQNIEIQRNLLLGIAAFDGAQWLEMDDAPNVVEMNHLFQDISTQSGELYDLSFRYRGRPGAPPAANTLGIRWDGIDLGTLTDPNPSVNDPWQLFSTTVTANSSVTRLQFEDRGPADPGFGMLVDDVRLTVVPEPSTFVLLSLGAVFVCYYSRRVARRIGVASK